MTEKARELFYKYGFKSVSMDDVAGFAGVSKKTLYTRFGSKDELVQRVVAEVVDEQQQYFDKCHSASDNAMEETLTQDDAVCHLCRGLKPGVFYDIEKYYPDAWLVVQQYGRELSDRIVKNLHRGQHEMLYRPDLNIPLVADLRWHQVMNVYKPGVLTSCEFSMKHLMDQYTLLYLRSIVTRAGLELLEKTAKKRKSYILQVNADKQQIKTNNNEYSTLDYTDCTWNNDVFTGSDEDVFIRRKVDPVQWRRPSP